MLPRHALAVALVSTLVAGCAASEPEDDAAPSSSGALTMNAAEADAFCGRVLEVGGRAPTEIAGRDITYDWAGRVTKIGDDEVDYTFGVLTAIGSAKVETSFGIITAIGSSAVSRSFGRVTKLGDAAVTFDWVGRPSKIGKAEIDYDMLGNVSSIGSGDVTYGWGVRTITEDTRLPLCLALYSSAAAVR